MGAHLDPKGTHSTLDSVIPNLHQETQIPVSPLPSPILQPRHIDKTVDVEEGRGEKVVGEEFIAQDAETKKLSSVEWENKLRLALRNWGLHLGSKLWWVECGDSFYYSNVKS